MDPSARMGPRSRVREGPELGRGRPDLRTSQNGSGRGSPIRLKSTSPRSTLAENLEASFPLIFFGGGCLAAAAFVLGDGSHLLIGRIPLWLPFMALGLIALVGGILSIFAEPDPLDEPISSDEQPPSHAMPLTPAVASIVRPSVPAASPGPNPISAGTALVARPFKVTNVPEPPRALVPRAPPIAGPETRNPIPPAVSAAPLLPDDATALLMEIDLISQDLRATRAGARLGGATENTSVPPTRAPSVATTPGATQPGVPSVAPRPSLPTASVPLEVPRRAVHCVGCGSVILAAGPPVQCQVCHEPLCSDCRDRSYAEGKPNMCPLCGLLDTVHARGPVGTRTAGPA